MHSHSDEQVPACQWRPNETHHLRFTVLTSTVWCPSAFSKYRRMSIDAIFSTLRNSIPYLFLIYISMLDTILSDCPSAAICCTAATCNGKLMGRFNLYTILPTFISDLVGQYNEERGITFGVAIVFWFLQVILFITEAALRWTNKQTKTLKKIGSLWVYLVNTALKSS